MHSISNKKKWIKLPETDQKYTLRNKWYIIAE